MVNIQQINPTLLAKANALGAALQVDKVRCAWCGIEGIYKVDIIETDYVDSTGHDTVRPMCRAIQACLDRGRG